VAHSLGIMTPAETAARITDVPAGTLTAMPSISRVTSCSALTPAVILGVP